MGVKVTLMLQFENALNWLGVSGQLLLTAKSPGLVPPNAMLVMLNGVLPVLLKVILSELLVTPVVWLGNVNAVSTSNAETDDVTPKPARLRTCVPPVYETVTVPVRAPATVGVKVTWKLQLELAFRVAVQLLLGIVKSPVWAKPRALTAEPVVFDTVTN